MSALVFMLDRTGSWKGVNLLHDPHSGKPDPTHSTARITPKLSGRFVMLDYTWSYQGKPQEGAILLGHDPSHRRLTAYWVDSWHMGKKGMTCVGEPDPDGAIDVKGNYAAPPDPDWGWRIVLRPLEANGWEMTMFNVSPDGVEYLAVEASYDVQEDE